MLPSHLCLISLLLAVIIVYYPKDMHLLLIILLSVSYSAVINIPADYLTIQAGIDASIDDDLVLGVGDQSIELLDISNYGEEGSVLYYSANVSPFSSSLNQIDSFGYAWTESVTDANTQYSWVDISSGNEVILLPNPDTGLPFEIEFPNGFPFYGINYSSVYIMADGWISFGDFEMSVLAFSYDLNPQTIGPSHTGSGNIRFSSNADRFVIWYDDVTLS